jgi:TetR/AcrR family transcriptional regulator, fatty acid metabolism regulator protein
VVVARSSGAGARAGRKAGSGPRPVTRRKPRRPAAAASRPPASGTRGRSADKQRETVERVAEGIFAKRGYRGTTMREVAAKAGCSVGQIYKLHPNKLELYRAIIESKAAVLGSMARQTLDSAASPEERLRRMVCLLLGFFQEHVAFFRVLALETGPLLVRGNRPFLDRVDEWREEILGQTTEAFRNGQRDGAFRPELDARLTAISFFGLLKEHTGEWILHMEGLLVDRADAILDLFFAGVRRGRKQ